MKTGKKLKVCGSITKRESLVIFDGEFMENTLVAEADQPYSNYYGRVPDKPCPNSLFLFTKNYYTLEEALRFTQNIDICAKNKVNAGSAVLHFKTRSMPAIRIRNFPDYKHLKMLQQCYAKQGVKFIRKTTIDPDALVTVNKCFHIKYAQEGIFLDQNEKNEGYIKLPFRLDWPGFQELLHKVWNNSDCLLFDAAMGGLIIDGHVHDIVRIYSGHLSLDLLKCLKAEFERWS